MGIEQIRISRIANQFRSNFFAKSVSIRRCKRNRRPFISSAHLSSFNVKNELSVLVWRHVGEVGSVRGFKVWLVLKADNSVVFLHAFQSRDIIHAFLFILEILVYVSV